MNSTKVNGKLEMCSYSTYIMNTNEWSCCSKCFSIPQNSLIKKIVFKLINLKIQPRCKSKGIYCNSCKYLPENRNIIIKNGKSNIQW